MGFHIFKFLLFALLAGPAIEGIMRDNAIEHTFLALFFIFWAAGVAYTRKFLLPMMYAICGFVVTAFGRTLYDAFQKGKYVSFFLFFVWLYWILKSDNKH